MNVLAPYLLTALINRPARLIYLSSGMHTSGRAALDDLDWNDRPWDGVQAYCDSKLLVTTLAAAVARYWPDVRSNAVDPGWVPTRMGGPHATDDLALGHDTQVWLATSDEPATATHRPVLASPTRPHTRSSRERHRLPGPVARHARTSHRPAVHRQPSPSGTRARPTSPSPDRTTR